MTIIQKYYIKEFIRIFSILAIGLSMFASLIELINRIDDFLPHNPSLEDLLYYGLLNIPSYFLYTMPVCILLSGLFVIGNAGRRRETVAIMSSGGSLKKVLSIFILIGVIMTFFSFLIGEFISPPATRKAHELKDYLSKPRGQNQIGFLSDMIWLRSKEGIIKINLYLPDRDLLKGVSIFRIDGDMLSERIEADYAEWKPDKGIWVLRNGTIYSIQKGVISSFTELPIEIMPPRVFSEAVRKPNEMNLKELLNYMKRLKEAGFKNNNLLVDMQSRIAYPFINLIMMVLGISLAVSGQMRSGLITAAIGIAISLLYWLLLSFALSMSYAGILPAYLGPWSIPLIFGSFAIYRFARIPE